MSFNKVERDLLAFVPNKMFFSLKECCELKGVNYKTLCNHPNLQPNKGRADMVCGKKAFRSDIVKKWLFLTDNDL